MFQYYKLEFPVTSESDAVHYPNVKTATAHVVIRAVEAERALAAAEEFLRKAKWTIADDANDLPVNPINIYNTEQTHERERWLYSHAAWYSPTVWIEAITEDGRPVVETIIPASRPRRKIKITNPQIL